jgi:hypothetical protein
MWQPFGGRLPAIAMVLVALAACAPADALNIVRYDGESLSISPPDGHCSLDPDDAQDQLFTGIADEEFGSDADLLLQYVPCEQLERWRGEGPYRIDGYGVVLVPFDLDPLGGTPREEFLRTMERAVADVDWADFEADYNDEQQSRPEFGGVGETRKLGRTNTALFIGWTYVAPDQMEEFAVVMAFTSLRGIPVAVIAASPVAYAGFDEILPDLRRYITELVEANP